MDEDRAGGGNINVAMSKSPASAFSERTRRVGHGRRGQEKMGSRSERTASQKHGRFRCASDSAEGFGVGSEKKKKPPGNGRHLQQQRKGGSGEGTSGGRRTEQHARKLTKKGGGFIAKRL